MNLPRISASSASGTFTPSPSIPVEGGAKPARTGKLVARHSSHSFFAGARGRGGGDRSVPLPQPNMIPILSQHDVERRSEAALVNLGDGDGRSHLEQASPRQGRRGVHKHSVRVVALGDGGDNYPR